MRGRDISARTVLFVVGATLVSWLGLTPLASADLAPPQTTGTELDGLPRGLAVASADRGGTVPVEVSEQIDAPIPFSMLAAEFPAGTEVWFRTAVGDDWTEWRALEVLPDDEAPDPEVEPGAPTPGTDYAMPTWVGEADRLQIRVAGASTRDVDVTLIDSMGLSRSLGDRLAQALGAGGAPAEAATRPGIVSRSQWGANESWRSGSPSTASRVTYGVLHHTAGSNDYTRQEAPGIVRGIYYYHTKSRGWSDIGYNLLVDKYGTIYEGRYGGLTNGVIGAHAAGYNTGSFGVSLMGNFTSVGPTSAMVKAARETIAWQFEAYGIDPNPSNAFWKGGKKLRNLNGHRDVGSTSCPGDRAYPLVSAYRSQVRDMIATGWTPVTGDWDGDGIDTAGWFKDGVWHLVNSNVSRADVWSFNFGTTGDRPVAGDWDGDGQDTIGVIHGKTWRLRNTNIDGPADHEFDYGRIDTGADQPLTGDFNGDGRDTVGIIRDREWHLRNDLRGGPGQIRFVYGRTTQGDLPFLGDWDGDGIDTPGIIRDGEWHLRNSQTGGPGDWRFTYGRVTRGDLPTVGDWTGNGIQNVAVIRGTGWYLRNELRGGNADTFFAFRPSDTAPPQRDDDASGTALDPDDTLKETVPGESEE